MDNELMEIILQKYVPDIYEEESACLLIFRCLTNISQQFIMRTLYLNINEIKLKDILDKINWFDKNELQTPKNYMKETCKLLYSNKIVNTSKDKDYLFFNENFKENLKNILDKGINLERIKISKKKDKIKSYEECFEYGLMQIEIFLSKLINLEKIARNEENETVRFLKKSKFLEDGANNQYMLTHVAINTLLSDRQTQVRRILTKYLRNNEVDGKNLDFVRFLFFLCTLNVGVPYACQGSISENNLKHLEEFRNFGIIWIKKSKRRFYVTPLIKCLFENFSNILDNKKNVKYLIIESNFKIYAYTDNNFEKSMLEILCEIEYIFPGFIVGNITRKSIREALRRGASSVSILKFFSLHANNLMDYKSVYNGITYNIPENVVQQIIIWEEEKNAIISQKAIYLSDFPLKEQFENLIKFLEKENFRILWKNTEPNQLVIAYESEEKINILKNELNKI